MKEKGKGQGSPGQGNQLFFGVDNHDTGGNNNTYILYRHIWIKPSRLILLFITISFKPKLSSDKQDYTN